jgi:choline dehydrogenase-like flavoprotein
MNAAIGANDVEAEVLIVGAGAAGGIAARHLAEAGVKVVCLEQGDWVDPAKYPGRNAHYELLARGRWHPDPNVRLLESDYPVNISESDVDLVMYNAVGGSTILWTALWHRFCPSDFRVRSLDGVAADWPISYEDVAPFYDRVEDQMGVSGLTGDPAHPPHSPYKLPPLPIGEMGMRFIRGMNKLGWHWWPGSNAIASKKHRELNACVRRGVCITGCSDGAKASTDVTHWPAAIAAGARLITGARVREVTVNSQGLATGAVYVDRAGQDRKIKAGLVILCGNGIGTPRLLLLSQSERFPRGLANSSDLVGRGLMLHPTASVAGIFAEPVATWIGPMGQHVSSMQFYETDKSRGFVRGSKWSLAPSGGPFGYAGGLPIVGQDAQRQMSKMFGHMLTLAVFAEDLPEEHNRIVLDDELTDSDLLPAPKVIYKVSENTRKLIAFNTARAAEAFAAAGAQETFATPVMREYGGAHLMGTARMGVDPATSVVDPWGRSHDVPNLFIYDASVFVTSSAVNPTATICALSLRFAEHLLQERRSQKVAA